MKKKHNHKSLRICSSKQIQISTPKFVSIDADPLELSYVMLVSGLYYKCELSWFNPNERHCDGIHIFPRDSFIGRTITDKNVGTFSDLCWTKDELEVDAFLCVCALNEEDTERINLVCVGNKEKKSIIGIFLKQEMPGAKQKINVIVKELKSKHKELFP